MAFGQAKKVVSSDVHWWGYKVAKSQASSHDGTITVKSGNIVMKGNEITGGSFVLDMNSINATDAREKCSGNQTVTLKTEISSKLKKFPTAAFKITQLRKTTTKHITVWLTETLL
ncbi:hypothetical protein [Chryseobacterium indoltheticum]|uniref:hypothetical protein n=1 Tax=Chryseobacterium indoltheticum TaxID=254 RepID=UPI003F4974E5